MTELSRTRMALYEDETLQLLVRACEWAERQDEERRFAFSQSIGNNTTPVFPKDKSEVRDTSKVSFDENSDSESSLSIEDGYDNESQNNSDGDSDEFNDNATIDETKPSSLPLDPAERPNAKLESNSKPKTPSKKSGNLQKRLHQAVNRHANNLIRIELSLPPSVADNLGEVGTSHENSQFQLLPAAALLPKDVHRDPVNARMQANAVKKLSEQLSSTSRDDAVVVVLLIQSGRFAGGVFRYGKCIAHRATIRYTIRKGQGKAQSTQDGTRRPKSMGSQLRRAGEEQLKVDIKTTLQKWTELGYIKNACLIFLACPKTMRSNVFPVADASGTKLRNKSTDYDGLMSKNDHRIRKVPFDVGRATFQNVEIVYEVVMGVDLCHVKDHLHPMKGNDADEPSEVDAATKPEIEDIKHDPEEEKRKRKEELALDLPMTPLHIASRDGKLAVLMGLLNKLNHGAVQGEDELDVDRPAGYDCMTPLHFAVAGSTKVDPLTASTLVLTLLVQAHADPTIHDAKGRPPYFLAKHDKVREAFRKARAILGEEYCDWDRGAKVGPPLTENDLEAKKDKEAEKKRRKKARQREKKAKAKATGEEAEKIRIADEKAKQAIKEAKRVRDGLSAKLVGENACDFCHKVCKGRNVSKNMFRRLDYKYCGTECVNKHKRELMAAAALARFG